MITGVQTEVGKLQQQHCGNFDHSTNGIFERGRGEGGKSG